MTAINNTFRSKVFKAAWTIMKSESASNLGEALKTAWAWAKKNLIEKSYAIYSIKRESEKAILAIVGYRFNHVAGESREITMWVPKSLVVNNSIPEWFYNKNIQ